MKRGRRWSEADLQQITGKKHNDRAAVSPANSQRNRNATPKQKIKAQEVDTRLCHISIICYRRGETDVHGVSDKAAIDGLVQAGLLPDDSRKYQPIEPLYTEHKCKAGEERTVIVINRFEDMASLCEWYVDEIRRKYLTERDQ